MGFTFCKEIQYRPRGWLKAVDCAQWPAARKHCKNRLVVGSNDVETTLRALGETHGRKDIDFLFLDVQDLLNVSIREALRALLGKQDRAWSVALEWDALNCDDMDSVQVEDATLREAFSVLGNAKRVFVNIDMMEGYVNDIFFVLNCLPTFRELNYMNLGPRWLKSLDDIIDIPFAPQVSGLLFNSSNLLQVFSSRSSQRLCEICCMDMAYEDEDEASMFIDALKSSLPALRRLEVCFPRFGREGYEEPIANLVSWLQSPQCQLTSFEVGMPNPDPDDLALLLEVVPKMRMLQYLALEYEGDFELDLNPDDLSQALEESPSLTFLSLNLQSLSVGLAKKIRYIQMTQRPRMLEIRIETSDGPDVIDEIHLNSLLYQYLRKFRRSEGHPTIPLSASLPMVLEKIGDFPTNMVTIDETFKILQDLLCEPHKLMCISSV